MPCCQERSSQSVEIPWQGAIAAMALLSASHAAYCANSTDTRPNAVAEAGQRAASIAQHPDAAFFACLRQRWLDFQCLHGQDDSELACTASLQPQFTYIHTDDHVHVPCACRNILQINIDFSSH